MRQSGRLLLSVAVIVITFFGILGQSWAESPNQQKTVLLRIHSFPMNPGEKIVGLMVTVSQGEIVHAAIPRDWSRQYTRMPDRKHRVHCFCLHSSNAISASGRMPVLTIADKSGSSNALSIEASVEIESGDGKKYTRQMRESELSVQ